MKTQPFRFILYVLIVYLTATTLNPTAAASEPSAGNGTHFCGVIDCPPNKQLSDQFPNRRYRTSAANLNVGEPRTVRMIYFLPNDRPYREDVVQRMKEMIRGVQTFYAEQMKLHGELTFRIETDPQGNAVVHRVDGKQPNSHYNDVDDTLDAVLDEIRLAFDLSANIYLIVIDSGMRELKLDGKSVAGVAGLAALIPDDLILDKDEWPWKVAAHELGHMFGLQHDFRKGAYIMSHAGLGLDQSQLSECHANFLSVHPYFNPDIPIQAGQPPTIKLISSLTYPSGSESVSVKVTLSDSEGLHQVFLFDEGAPGFGNLFYFRVWGCRGLAGEKEATVEFNYESGKGLYLSDRDKHSITIGAVDIKGNMIYESFVLEVEDTSEQPRVPTIEKISGFHQQGPINTQLAQPFVVELRDQYGDLLPGEQISFIVIVGAGRFSGQFSIEEVMTDTNGRAERALTLGPYPGDNVITVRAPRLSACLPVNFSALGVGVPPVSIMGDDYQTWHLPDGAISRFGKGRFDTSDRVVDFSPDGRSLAVASSIGVWIYDVVTARELALLPKRPNVTWFSWYEPGASVSFSPDGATLASGASDGTITLWDVVTATEIVTFSGPVSITSVAFSPDGRTLATGTNLEGIGLWDVETGRSVATLLKNRLVGTYHRTSVSFSPDGSTLAAGFDDGTVKLWDIATRTRIATLPGHQEPVYSMAFSPDGKTLASGSGDGTVKLWDVAIKENIASFKYRHSVSSVSFSPDGRTLAAGLGYGQVELWDLATGTKIATFEEQHAWNTWFASVSFSPDGRTLAIASGNGTVNLRDVETGNAKKLYGNMQVGNSVSFSPDGSLLASGSTDGTVQLWDVETGRNINRYFRLHDPRDSGYLQSVVSFSPDGATLAAGIEDIVMLWDVNTGTNIARFFDGNGRGLLSMSFSPDGTTLAQGHIDKIILREVETGTVRGTPPKSQLLNSMSLSPDGNTLASASTDGMELWDASTLTPIADMGARYVWCVAFSPDGMTLASGSTDGMALWDVATRTRIAMLSAPREYIKSVAFSPDGTTLASGAQDDGTVKLWDVQTQKNIATLDGHTGQVKSVAFSPDGTTLASGSTDGTILLWDLTALLLPVSVEPTKFDNQAADVNGDGSVNILDLVVIVASLGQSGQNDADVNGDGVISILDLVLVAGMFDEAVAAPSAHPQATETLTAVEVQGWLTDARALEVRDPIMKRGFVVLEQLLAALTPTETELLSNYPNPFNPETWIPYRLAEDAFVTLTIYDLSGRVVRTLNVGHRIAALYENRSKAIYWDGRNDVGEQVASGLYFYTLTAGDYSATRRMVILK